MTRFLAATIAAIVVTVSTLVVAQTPRPPELLLKAAQQKEEVEGDLAGALEDYKKISQMTDRAIAAKALVRMAGCYEKLGDPEAQAVYARIVREFADQKDAVDVARAHANTASASATAGIPREVWSGDGGNPAARAVTSNTSVSPDGRLLVFSGDETADIAAHELGTGTVRHLTNTGGWPSGRYTAKPIISPDGRQIAYDMYIDKDAEHTVELRIASVAAGESVPPQVIRRTTQDETSYPAAWTPDGRALVVLRATPDRTWQIGTVSVQDGAFRNIKSLEWRRPNLMSLSPDGQYVAYDVPAGEPGSPNDIFVLAMDGSRETAAVRNPANDAFPVWTADGRGLLFLSDRDGRNSLWMVPMERGRASGGAIQVKRDVGPIVPLGMSRSGTFFYFEPPTIHQNVFTADLEGTHVSRPPTPASERLFSANSGSTWSRNGEYLAYYSVRAASADTDATVLVVRTVKTGEERTISVPSRVMTGFAPRWFPDNHTMLIASRDAQGTGAGYYRLSLDTANTELLIHLPQANSIKGDLSADGRTAFYVTQNTRLWRLDVESRRETEIPLTMVPGNPSGGKLQVVAMAVSPNGQEIAANLGGTITILPAAGGPSHEVFRLGSATDDTRGSLAWSADQRTLFFTQRDGFIWSVPAHGGAAEKIGLPQMRQDWTLAYLSLGVNPDGTRLVFSPQPVPTPPAKVWAIDRIVPNAGSRRTLMRSTAHQGARAASRVASPVLRRCRPSFRT